MLINQAQNLNFISHSYCSDYMKDLKKKKKKPYPVKPEFLEYFYRAIPDSHGIAGSGKLFSLLTYNCHEF